MSRLRYVNFCGVLALAGLCIVQWHRDRRLNLEVNRLERARLEAASKATEQAQGLRGLQDDLAQLKATYGKSAAELGHTRESLRLAERETLQLTAERDQLKTSLTNWVAAVAARDQRLAELEMRLRRLTAELNDSIQKYNELASNHNAVVRDLNERTRQLNLLTERLNKAASR